MKKITLLALVVLTVASCQQKMPTISPSEATLYVGDTLQLDVMGENAPQWMVGFNREDRKDSAKFVTILPVNKVVANKAGDISLGFQHYKNNTLGQQVSFIFTRLHILTLPSVLPSKHTMYVGDTLSLVVQGIKNPMWEFDYLGVQVEKDIIQLTDSNQVIAIEPGQVKIGFHYDSKSSVGPTVRSSFTQITIL